MHSFSRGGAIKTQAEEARRALLQSVGLEPNGDCWLAGWDASFAAWPGDAHRLIEANFLASQCQALAISPEVTGVLLEGATLFARQPALLRLLWHCYFALFKDPKVTRYDVRAWPMLPTALDPAAPLFYAYVFLSGAPHVLAQHAKRGIASEISVDTLADLELWIRHYRQAEGAWGFSEHGWLQFHFGGKLYKLGRLQFEISLYYLEHPVFRHRRTGEVIVLAAAGKRFRRDGQYDGANGLTDPHAWTSTLQTTPRGVTGYPLHPLGHAELQSVTLQADKWEQLLARRDPALGVHIPATGRMDFAACGESFARALPFFADHFPEFQPRAFICTSWLLDAQLANQLDAQSNIVRFLREWYLLPLEGADDHETFGRVFGIAPGADPTTLPQRTSLQRAIVAHALGGGQWREACGLIIPDAQLQWGEQVYQSTWPVKID